MKIFKIISLCLCFSVISFAVEGAELKAEAKSIKINNLFAPKDNGQAQESNRDVCDETATVTGFGDYDLNGSVNLCYADGSGFYEFAWDGGCTLMTLSYSGGDLDASGYGFTTGLFFYGFEGGALEDFVLIFDDGTVLNMRKHAGYLVNLEV